MITVGERVVVKGWHLPVYVTRIYWEDKDGNETDIQAFATCVRLELEWHIGEDRSKSKVMLHDEDKTWYRYSTAS